MVWVGVLSGSPQEVLDSKPEGEAVGAYAWVETDDCFANYITQEYVVENNKVVPPSKEYLLNQLRGDLADIRYISQCYKITYKGFEYLTSSEVSSVISEKITDANISKDPSKYNINFKSFSGYTILNLEDLKAIKNLITEHVQACFDREAEILLLFDKEFKKEKNLSKIIEMYVSEVSVGWPLPNNKTES